MKKHLPAILAGMLGALVITAAPVWAMKVWGPTERVLNSDLNANFTEAANNNLTNSNLASNAAIAHSKLATPALVPKAFAAVVTACNGAAAAGTACTVDDSSQVTAVKANGTQGQFRVDLAYSPPNANFVVLVTSISSSLYCVAHTYTATTGDANGTNFLVVCLTDAGGVPGGNVSFSFVLLDS